MADLMYVVAISKVMHKLRDVLRNNHLISTYVMHNTNEVKELLEVGYIDDSMIPSFGPAQGIVAESCLTAECAAEVFQQYGMLLNSCQANQKFWLFGEARTP